MDIYERLDFLLKTKQMTAYRLSKELGYAKSGTFYAIMSKKVKPSYDTLTAILTRYDDINGDWLLRGTGEAFKTAHTRPGTTTTTLPINVTENLKETTAATAQLSLLTERVVALGQQLQDREEIIQLLKQQILLMRELMQRQTVSLQ
ncbi:MAG: helix-turn-helix domain-containing protein [Cytophagaceae bacterium]|nr:helix-turn-helix domain-containing protein [Cytophagaceae bacterium]